MESINCIETENVMIINKNIDDINVKMNSQNRERTSHDHINDSGSIPNKTSTVITKMKSNDIKKDIYMVAEGYHKTDSCYYRTPDGGYHKLPPDSYHKMSEICYNKLPDGSFKRLVDIKTSGSKEAGINRSLEEENVGKSNSVRNHMIKFLKRSKSHSQATAKETFINYRKEYQRNKEKEKEMEKDREKEKDNWYHIKNSNSAGNSLQKQIQHAQNSIGNKCTTGTNNHLNQRHMNNTGNRKVVVTMMENGGLPIVATSKTKSPKIELKTHQHSSTRDKVKHNILINKKFLLAFLMTVMVVLIKFRIN